MILRLVSKDNDIEYFVGLANVVIQATILNLREANLIITYDDTDYECLGVDYGLFVEQISNNRSLITLGYDCRNTWIKVVE